MRFILLFILSFSAYAKVRSLNTARLQSTSGAGVASILVTEAALLNPATTAFFSDTHISYQGSTTSLNKENDDREGDNNKFPKNNNSNGLFVFDNSGTLKGGLSWQKQKEQNEERQRMTGTFSAPITGNAAAGFTYRHTTDTGRPNSKKRHDTWHSVVLGFTYIQSPKLVFGAIWEDPFLADREDSQAVVGMQYSLTDMFTLITDFGANPAESVSDYYLWRGALQLNVFGDFFVRGGKFAEHNHNLEGESWGASWTGPKLSIDFAMRFSRQIDSEKGRLYPKENLVDTSIAASLRF